MARIGSGFLGWSAFREAAALSRRRSRILPTEPAKGLLAYSSIGHSGYLLIGVIAGPGMGINAVLFYLLAYGVMNTAAFAVLSGLQRQGEEIESLDDLAGLRHRYPVMSVIMAVAALSPLGFPPLLGSWDKSSLLLAGISDRPLLRLRDRRP